MAARTRKLFIDDRTREKIRTTQLINRLQNHVFSDDPKAKLDQSQIKAIEILLRKSVPDLSAVEGNVSMSVSHDDAVKEIEKILSVTATETTNVSIN